MKQPIIGMIVPPAAGDVPPEAYGLYPEGVTFCATGLGLAALTIEDYADAIRHNADCARRLREDHGADVVSLMGTSLSFFRGGAHNDALIKAMEDAAGVPCTTMSVAIRDGLRAVGARRVAVGTAYTDRVNERLRTFLETEGFELASLIGLGLEQIADIRAVEEPEVSDLARRAFKAAGGDADAVFVSCGGLPALHLAPEVEPELGVPVIASSTAGVWGVARLASLDTERDALGALGRVSAAPAEAAE
ncbi:MAG: aspartate/glutamate racemase family protein [Devosia sp.]